MTRSRKHSIVLASLLITIFVSGTAATQSAAIRGRVVDEQQRPVAGATVTLTDRRTGVTRTDDSSDNGLYRLEGLPNGSYDISASRAGFATVKHPATTVQVGAVVYVDFTLPVAAIAETVTVVERRALVDSSSATVGGVVEPRRIEELPLNGRQFANLAATLPGVSIAFHRDPTKGTQYSPQVNGGTGRSVNYLVDGGDNNDDTVGGQLQLFPLDAVEEFRFSTASYKAENGRGSGGIMNVVTKSGTNRWSGGAFIFFRDEALNARTMTEELAGVPRQDYSRWQYGGSFGGPIRRNVAHFFGAIERVAQDTSQAVDTLGLFPDLDGIFPVAYRETLISVKASAKLRTADQAWVRYGADTASQPAGVNARTPAQSWGDNRNHFRSINGRYTSILGGDTLNELTFQYSTFLNTITSRTTDPQQVFPSGVVVGQGLNLPQSTWQRKIHIRDDLSRQLGGGLGHALKTGFSLLHDPRLGSPAWVEPAGTLFYNHITDDPLGPLARVGGNISTAPLSFPAVNTPITQFGLYMQDDWRLIDRLTVNAGLRYDLAIGYQIDQSKNPNFLVLQEAGRSGELAGMIGLEDFGRTPRNDHDNIQPRLGFAFDVRGRARDVIRGSWGIYTDTAYTNSNILFAAGDALGIFTTGQFLASDPDGLRNPDGSFFRVGDPISNIASLNEGGESGLAGEVVSPRLQQPYVRQSSFGWSHQLNGSTAFGADVIHAEGRDLSVRARLNSRPNGGPRRFAGLALDPNSANFRVVISPLRSTYDALILALRRRSLAGIDVALNYTLSRAKSELGQAVDETGLGPNTIQDATNPIAPVAFGPAAGDARHLISISAVVPLKWRVQVAPILYYRSALPVFTTEGLDRNGDTVNNDIPDRAFAFDGIGRAPRDTGPCRTINCGRGAAASQLNLRISKRIVLHASHIDFIAEVFNLFDASNPSAFNGRRLLGTPANASSNEGFMQPASFSGDFQRPEQRVGQVALRWGF